MYKLTLLTTLLLHAVKAKKDFISGWNLPSNNADGSCKTSADWAADFAVINGEFRRQFAAGRAGVKVFNSAQCDTAAAIAEPAIAANIKVALGVWASEGGGRFDVEVQAMNAAIKTRGCAWLSAIVVGSEDLYRKEISPERLAEQILQVKGIVRSYGGACSTVPLTHADTRTEWVKPQNAKVIQACDVILNNAFAYWKGVEVDQAGAYMKEAIDVVRKVAGGKEVWVGETGWPTGGKTFDKAVPTVANLRQTWRLTKCPQLGGPLFGVNTFWFAAFDQPTREEGVERHFGVATSDRQLKISLSCP